MHYAGIELICTPANHNSGRTYFDKNATLWASWVIKGKEETLYFSGDSAYDSHFSEIAQRCGPIDIACLEVAADVKGQGYPVENWGAHAGSSYRASVSRFKCEKTVASTLGYIRTVYSPLGRTDFRFAYPLSKRTYNAADANAGGESFYVHQEHINKQWWREKEIGEPARILT